MKVHWKINGEMRSREKRKRSTYFSSAFPRVNTLLGRLRFTSSSHNTFFLGARGLEPGHRKSDVTELFSQRQAGSSAALFTRPKSSQILVTSSS